MKKKEEIGMLLAWRLFPKIVDKYIQIGGISVAVLAVAGITAFAYFTAPTNVKTGYRTRPARPLQPQTARRNMGMDCYYCHYTVYKAAYAAIPPTEVCMNCHAQGQPRALFSRKCEKAMPPGNRFPGSTFTSWPTTCISTTARTLGPGSVASAATDESTR